MTINRQWLLHRRPDGWPSSDDFRLVEIPAPTPHNGALLVRCLFLSVDPYMRGRMRDRKSYAPPAALGEVMVGGAVGRVVESRSPAIAVGDIVEVPGFGWQDYAVCKPHNVRKVETGKLPASLALGVLGMPGATAYFGLFDILRPRPGDTVVVSGAAGAVGSVVGQLARLAGCRPIGIAGSDDKTAWLTDELGFAAAINYKTESVAERLAALCPAGVDRYFDNVGGPVTDAVMPNLAQRARVAICGQISQYNLEAAEPGPRQLWHLIAKRATLQGFLVFDYAARMQEALTRLGAWVAAGELRYRETVVEGLPNAPQAFIDMMRGKNLGKMVVKVAP